MIASGRPAPIASVRPAAIASGRPAAIASGKPARLCSAALLDCDLQACWIAIGRLAIFLNRQAKTKKIGEVAMGDLCRQLSMKKTD